MLNRRRALGFLGAGASTLLSSRAVGSDAPIRVAGEDVEVRIARVSPYTVRIGILPMRNGKAATVPVDGSLVRDAWEEPLLRLRDASENKVFSTGNVQVRVSFDPLTFSIQTRDGRAVQTLKVEAETGIVTFESGDAPVLGLGEGGPQFDRRGSIETMHNGQSGYRLRTNGSRVPIPWLIGTAGWAMFFHQPFGTFDLTGAQCKFQPPAPAAALALDLFVIASREPAVIMSEYARLTGHSEMPPLWALGYQQSHRTLASREEVLAEARMFRQKRLPCDALIYLGTGFCPSGWNTANGSFSWNRRVFPDPKEMLAEFHREHFKIVLHAVILSRTLHGRVRDGCELARFDEERASCNWDAHREVFDEGVDGWWPDEGD
ncbi:MAG: TIM-barrel domain-containing protein, partial [Bryobacteraceae bacterium]